MTEEQEKPLTPLDKLKALLERRRTERKEMLDSRFTPMPQSEAESEQERCDRVMDDPGAWT